MRGGRGVQACCRVMVAEVDAAELTKEGRTTRHCHGAVYNNTRGAGQTNRIAVLVANIILDSNVCWVNRGTRA